MQAIKKILVLSLMASAALCSQAERLTPDEQRAMDMLNAYMPLPDKTAHSQEFFLNHVRSILKAREEMPWGKNVPDKEFYHFVLPIRVNNEVLSPYSPIIYAELKDRIKDMNMKDAILEVNHWCHEKVTYQPSDPRTHSPLESMKSAIGRCGEESTFTVSALRSMGIPARQVYTPRWAHTDDNHAWVEAWADGKWWFLGACEPEAVLNLGWFNAPASRGMLMNTRVFGDYHGSEEELLKIPGYTDINVTDTYADMKTTEIEVVDMTGKPVPGAKVSFRIYNYAEYYPLCIKTADSDGRTSLRTGKGSMVVWASDGNGCYGVAHVPGDAESFIVTLDSCPGEVYDIDVVPPHGNYVPVTLSESQVALNEARKAYEDSIRMAYVATFVGAERAASIASELGLDLDRTVKIFEKARGNHATIHDFLRGLPDWDRNRGLQMLEALSVKDVCDVSPEVLADHIKTPLQDTPLYVEYILNPRVSTEFLVPYRNAIRSAFSEKEIDAMQMNPELWRRWVAENIEIVDNWQPMTVFMDPLSTLNARKTNALSRDIFYVAGARSLGIPTRLESVRTVPQVADANGRWIDVTFAADDSEETATSFGSLRLTYEPTRFIPNPNYYIHFTISKIVDGMPRLLNYADDATFNDTFAEGVELETGRYILTTGQRMADGSVLAHNRFFNISEGGDVTLPLTIRQDDSQISVIGNFNSENIYHDKCLNADKSILSTTGRGYYVLIYGAPNNEPTNHALRDIAMLADQFEKEGVPMLLLFGNEDKLARYDAASLPTMPTTTTVGCDVDSKIAAELKESLRLNVEDAPVIIIADTFNRVVFETQGYNIGAGQKIMEVLLKILE